MNSKRRLSLTSSAHKLKLDSVNKILKIDKSKKQKKDAINKQVSRVALAELIKNTPTQCQQAPDFRLFLTKEENIKVFKEFLKAQYCQENLDFYLACEKYKNLRPDGVGKELVKFMATQIYNNFLSDDARQSVNVNNACIQTIKNNLKDPQPDLLSDAQAEVFELMKTDCYPRFCRTWQLDKDLAHKILYRTKYQTRGNQSSSLMNSFGNEASTTSPYSVNASLSSRTSSRLTSKQDASSIRSRSISSDSTSECPPECPYFRIGRLPCQRHKRTTPHLNKVQNQKRKSILKNVDLTNHVDLREIHRLPPVCTVENGLPLPLSNSPPPLPPKPDYIDTALIHTNKKYCPYVGKAFNV